jgi:hypothetical protein
MGSKSKKYIFTESPGRQAREVGTTGSREGAAGGIPPKGNEERQKRRRSKREGRGELKGDGFDARDRAETKAQEAAVAHASDGRAVPRCSELGVSLGPWRRRLPSLGRGRRRWRGSSSAREHRQGQGQGGLGRGCCGCGCGCGCG